jgi:hypothetical protein
MEGELAVATLELDRTSFVARFPRWFLIIPFANVPRPSVRFHTVACDDPNVLPPVDDDEATLSLKSPRWSRDPWSPEALKKREGSPVSDRISLGRADHVDVVIRSRFVSKLHAHVILPAGADATITDLESQNGTFVNNARLDAHKPAVISNGDVVSFGQVHCEFAMSDVVYYALRRKYRLLHELQGARATRRDSGMAR